MTIIFGVFILLHGMVHLLYFGQSARFFELKPGMAWTDGSWAFSGLVGDVTARSIASISLILAALVLIAGGIGIFAGQAWWRPVVVSGVLFSTIIYVLFWNGKMQDLDGQGGVGILINLAILVAVLVLRWPRVEF